MTSEEKAGCVAVIGLVLVLLFSWFGMPYICMIAWEAIASAFSLPLFTYWQWFFISWAIRWLFKSTISTTNKNAGC